MNRLLLIAGPLVTLAALPAALGEETPFNYVADERHVTVSYWMKLYKGLGTQGPVVFELSGSTHSGEGSISGVVVHNGDEISQVQIQSWTGATTSPLYAEGYVEGIHLEVEVPHIGVFFRPSAYLDVLPNGDFSGYMWDTITPGSELLVTVADLITYDVDLGIGRYGNHPVYGNVALIDGVPRLSVTEVDANIYYLDTYGFDYTFEGELDVSVSIPEPMTAWFVLAGLAAMCPRRSRVVGY